MAELVGGAALGAALGALLDEVVDMTRKTARFRTQLQSLKDTLEEIQQSVDESSILLGRLPDKEMRAFISYLEDGKELVRKCSRVKFWNVYDKFDYVTQLMRLDSKLRKSSRIDAQTNIMRVLAKVEGLDKNATTRAGGFSGSCGVPGYPEFVIGLDQLHAELKYSLLNDDKKVLVISGPGGCGKTTLAQMLCHDNDIKGKFCENILYVTVSRPSSLKTIAQNLREHYRMNHREFRTDEEAKNHIEMLLKDMGPGNKLLVLDDVWDGSESLVQDLSFQIQGFKILVTSRFTFKCFGTPYELGLLNEKDAKTLFIHCASSYGALITANDDLVNKIVKSCSGLPLALSVVGASLCGESDIMWKATLKKWSEGQSVLETHQRLLLCLQTSIDALNEWHKECFLDLGAFPEDDRIAGTLLVDMWLELYPLDDEGMFLNLIDLSFRNLINLATIRKYVSEIEGNGSEHYVTQHDLLRELAIHLSSQEPLAERKRLYMEIHRNEVPKWWTLKTEQPINARILSISTDETFSSKWFDLNAPNVEVLILNIRSKTYDLPKFIARMSKLKVLIVTGYGSYATKLEKLEFLGSLSNLTTVRFEHVLVSPSIKVIFTLHNLKKLRLVTCGIGNALESVSSDSHTLPSFTDLEMDRCYDLKELPTGLSNIFSLQKLTITNCHELTALPEELGNLSNVKTLSLHSCTNLHKLPKSIGSMHGLGSIDISDCLSIKVLPEQIGELSGLNVLNMSGCRGLQELPESVSKLSQLEYVICDEETSHLWRHFQTDLSSMKIHVVKDDRLGSLMNIIR